MRHLTVLALLSLLCVALPAQTPVGPAAADPGTSHLFRVPAPVPPALHALLHREFDILGGCSSQVPAGEDLHVVVQPGAELQRFRTLVPQAVAVDRGRPFHEVYAELRAAAPEAPDPLYYTVAEIEQEIDALVAQAPSICQKVDITTLSGAAPTHQGRGIYALKISDNVAQDEDEPAALVIAQHHARELNTPHMVIGAMRRVVQGYASDPGLQALVDSRELWFVPCMNPDGVDYVWNVDQWWRKNRRANGGGSYGVDLNRNYPTNWGLCGASSRTSSNIYKGPGPASEPEVQSLIALAEMIRPEIYIDFHSHGREVLSTYPPCASVSNTTRALVVRYADDLRAPMNYAERPPAASGEAPEHMWVRGGTMSFLVEISTSFQPSFSSTITEEARVWPGLRRALTTWRPAVRGHVRSIFRGAPVPDAEVHWGPNQFHEGEVTTVRPRDGRYGLWLPTGTWQVTWSAPGFVSETRTVQVTGYDTPSQIEDVTLVPAWQPATLTKTGNDRIGTTTTLDYHSPGDDGLQAWIALSDSTTPGLPLGPRTLPLTPDALFFASLNAAPLLTGNLGNLSAGATLSASLNIPGLAPLVGIDFHAAGITLEAGYPQGVKRWSSPVSIVIQP